MMEPASDELIADMKAGLKGVTPGPWQVQDGCSWRRIGSLRGDGNVLCPTISRTDRHPDLTAGTGEDVYRNLRHIARCSPDNIAAILSRLEQAEAERDSLREALEAEKRKTRLHVGATYEPTGERMRAYFPDKRCYQLMLEMAHDLKIAETSGRIVKNVDGPEIEKVNVREWASKRARALKDRP